ncbi:zinc finger CCCH domain-containing protein 10-like [Culicoides brevitarsis]|uniref:zinc finger CCCH domain-containing protein 10-like n=1 Tax=Culicoides brevitarsis TaxID=469753 RepID=UPI00307BB7DB
MSINSGNGQQGGNRNKRIKTENEQNSQKDDYQDRETDEQHAQGRPMKQPMNRICRDFVRGLCRRKYCRYPHVLSPDLVVFCHDFQNTYCPRINCKFLHYSIEDEEHYRKYGEFPQTEDKDALPPPPPPQIYDRYSRDFHYNNNPNNRQRDNEQQGPFSSNGYRNYDHSFMPPRDFLRRDDFANGLKRPSSNNERAYDGFKRFCNGNDDDQPDIMAVIRKFEEEQAMLRRRVEANEVKIAELRASNEFLLSQNAQLRMNTVQVSRVVSTVTNTAPQAAGQSQAAVINTVSMAPVQMTPIVSMTTAQQPTIIASASPHLAIAASTSQGQLTIAQPNISALNTSTQQLAPINQITLTPTLAHPGLATINTSQGLAMSNATIMTPTIMTHSILPH